MLPLLFGLVGRAPFGYRPHTHKPLLGRGLVVTGTPPGRSCLIPACVNALPPSLNVKGLNFPLNLGSACFPQG